MTKFLKNHYPVVVSLLIFWLIIMVLYNLSLRQTGGIFVYSLDDSYIHMSLAKHFIESGTIGINNGVFSYCTSSLLWTSLLILFFKIFGINTFIPLMVNIVLASVLIIVAFSFIHKKLKNPVITMIVLILLIIGTPLCALVFNGLEHVLHIFVTIIFIHFSVEFITDKKKFTKFGWTLFRLMFIALTLTATRFEGLFLIFIVSLFILIRKKYFGGILVFFSGILPIIIAGFYSFSKGWQFLPSSVILKGNIPGGGLSKIIKSFFYTFYPNLAESGSLVIIVTLLMIFFVLIYSKVRRLRYKSLTILLIVLLMTALHLQFASIGWFYRYEAYLIFTGILFLSVSISEISNLYKEKFHYFEDKKIKFGFAFILLFALSPIINRGVESFNRIPFASKNIYEQQYLTSGFLNKYMNNIPVAMHDIGAASLNSKAKIIDLWGLADKDIFYAKLNGNCNTEFLNKKLRNESVKVAILYENWFDGNLNFLDKWMKCGSWKIQNNFVCGCDEISFFAKDSSTFIKLTENLKEYSKNLPSSVIQKGWYKQKQEK